MSCLGVGSAGDKFVEVLVAVLFIRDCGERTEVRSALSHRVGTLYCGQAVWVGF